MDILHFTSIAQAIKKSHQARHALTGIDSAIHVSVKVSLCVDVCFFFRFQTRGLGCAILRGQRPNLDGTAWPSNHHPVHSWHARIIILPKWKKDTSNDTSKVEPCRSVSLLPILLILFEGLLVNKMLLLPNADKSFLITDGT